MHVLLQLSEQPKRLLPAAGARLGQAMASNGCLDSEWCGHGEIAGVRVNLNSIKLYYRVWLPKGAKRSPNDLAQKQDYLVNSNSYTEKLIRFVLGAPPHIEIR